MVIGCQRRRQHFWHCRRHQNGSFPYRGRHCLRIRHAGRRFSGGGASTTLVELGAVNAIAGSFMCACAAALTVYWMVNSGIPVSTSQSIVGAIIGWNFYSGKETDYGILSQIVSTWILCPLLAGIIAILLYWLIRFWLKHSRIHLLRQDSYTRIALIITGAFGAYALGSNNIGNVMGVFVDANPLQSVSLKYLHLSGTQLLFLIGSLAVSVGIFTRSHKIMRTIGKKIMVMTPVAAWIVVISQSIVLFIFASQGLEQFLLSRGLPALPLVPVSSSQAVIGAVMGIGLAKGGHNMSWGLLARIALGWFTTPVISAVICFISLFFLENVFNQVVYLP